ncbi:MFS transporter [Salinicoccus sp. ID82-1]|uniref:MFS transporter n=1 Tax=Salinicoccus sp. ID82-1 TaxID=2820269 RepID=UPI001F02A8A8|nr:MFS transporter [Salinicoccus sp. ID82-1]MCG1010002.1 MFS transporter [Salinicoccus sp. ID82-1]
MTTKDHKKRFWKLAFILCLTEVVRGMFILSYLPALPTIGIISIGLSSIVITMHYVFDAVTNIWLGFIMRKIGAWWTMFLSYLVGIGAMVVVMFDQSFYVLLIAACLLGISVCPIWIIALSNVQDEKRGREMGLIFFAWLCGLGSGMVIMNFLIGIFDAASVYAMGAVFLVNFIVFLVMPGDYKVEAREGVAEDRRKRRLPLKETWVILRRHMKNMPGIMLQGLGVGMLLPILPTYITSLLELNYFEYTFFILLVFGIVAFSMTVLSRALDLHTEGFTRTIIVAGFLVYAVGVIWFSTLETVWLIFIIASLIGLSYGVMLPAWNKFLAGSIASSDKEESWGVISSIQGIGAMIGPMLGGLTADLFGTVTATLMASGIIFLILFAYYAVLYTLERRTAKG